MKHFYTTITPSILVLLLASCTSSPTVAPSQNDELNKISNSKGKEKSSYMQKGLDSWLENEWQPKVAQDKKIQTKYMLKNSKEQHTENPNRSFTLQEYVEKSEVYFKDKERDLENSHVEKLKRMPVIGK